MGVAGSARTSPLVSMIPSPLEGRGEGEGFLPPRPLRERVRVRGIHSIENSLQHCLRLGQHLVVPEAKHPIARPDERLSPTLISLNLISMMSAVEFDH